MVKIICSWLIISMYSMLHPYYISVVDLNLNPKDKNLELSIRIFSNDFEKALKDTYNKSFNLSDDTKKNINNQYIADYITKNLWVKTNADNSHLYFNYLGYEIINESVWIYAEHNNTKPFSQLSINCSLLYSSFTQQCNIIHAKQNNIEKSYKLDNPKKETVLRW